MECDRHVDSQEVVERIDALLNECTREQQSFYRCIRRLILEHEQLSAELTTIKRDSTTVTPHRHRSKNEELDGDTEPGGAGGVAFRGGERGEHPLGPMKWLDSVDSMGGTLQSHRSSAGHHVAKGIWAAEPKPPTSGVSSGIRRVSVEEDAASDATSRTDVTPVPCGTPPPELTVAFRGRDSYERRTSATLDSATRRMSDVSRMSGRQSGGRTSESQTRGSANTTQACVIVPEHYHRREALSLHRRPTVFSKEIRKSFYDKPTRSKWEEASRKVWRFLEQPDQSIENRLFHMGWAVMITVSVCTAIASESALPDRVMESLRIFEIICTVLFTFEFALKVLCSPRKLIFLKSVYTIIDFVVIFQGFAPFFFLSTRSKPMTLLKTQAPIMRLLKIARHSSGWRLLVIALRRCREPLKIPLYLMILMVTFAGSLLHWVENSFAEDTNTTPAFRSIPHAMWFVLVTISTVGYGDVYPNTDFGKMVGSLLIIAGVGYLAMPLSIIGDQFGETWKQRHVLLTLERMKQSMGGKVDLALLSEVFLECDDGSGEISLDEFFKITQQLEMGFTRRAAREVFLVIDADSSGKICFQELEEFLGIEY